MHLSLSYSDYDPRTLTMLDHIRDLLDRASARIGLLTSEEAQWRQQQRLKRAEDERNAQLELVRRRAEVNRLREERERARLEAARAVAEARRAAGRALYQARTKNLRERVAAGLPYYQKMVYELAARQPFMSAILSDPTNDGTRLVYCDWLEDQGDADAALWLRTHSLSIPIYDEEIGFPDRARGYLRQWDRRWRIRNSNDGRTLGELLNYRVFDLYHTIPNFGWVAVADVQETLESIGLSLKPCLNGTMDDITPAYIRPMLARLYPNAKET
jgi:uncharacterized protein (TIGR02996 family)